MTDSSLSRTLLLTGATGLLGWALARRLATDGWTLYLLVRKSARKIARERIATWRTVEPEAADRLRLVTGDLGRPELLDEEGIRARVLMECGGVVHCAVDRRAGADRGALFDANVGGTRALLDLCAQLGTGGRFLHVSDLSVCGDASGVFFESDLLVGQSFAGDFVAETRLLAERRVREARSVRWTVVRLAPLLSPEEDLRRAPDPYRLLREELRRASAVPIPALRRLPRLAQGLAHGIARADALDLVAAALHDEDSVRATLHGADPCADSTGALLARLRRSRGLRVAWPLSPVLSLGLPAGRCRLDTTAADALRRRHGLTLSSTRDALDAVMGSSA